MDWTIVAVPAATVLGAGLAVFGGWLAARQREHAARREEWGRRFEVALQELSNRSSPERIFVGRAILKALARSDLASNEDRRLAVEILSRDADLASLPDNDGAVNLDTPSEVEDT